MNTLDKITKNTNLMINTSWVGVAIGMLSSTAEGLNIGMGIWAGGAVAGIKYMADTIKYNPFLYYKGARK